MPKTGRVRVVVADGQLASTMRRFGEIEVVGECAPGAAAVDAIRALHPDVAVLDVHDGLGVLEALDGLAERPRVLLLSDEPAGELVFSALAAGAAGYLAKDTDPDEVCAAVTAAGEGMAVQAPRLQTALAVNALALTEREHEVLRLTAEGHSPPELARLLFVSPGMVETELQAICDKLGVAEGSAAVAEAMRRGLLG